jgi:hypothetical protein
MVTQTGVMTFINNQKIEVVCRKNILQSYVNQMESGKMKVEKTTKTRLSPPRLKTNVSLFFKRNSHT